MLKRLTRKLLTLAVLCIALFTLSTPDAAVKAQVNCSCFSACDQELAACEQWGQGCPYPNEGEIYQSDSPWFRTLSINCASYAAGDCSLAYRLCSSDCAENCVQ
jgi:hypothetical protein